MRTTDTDLSDFTLTIPYPSYIPRARGINAVAKFNTKLTAGCSVAEYEVVQEAAHLLGLPFATMIRWCAVECAKQVLANQARKDSKNDDPSE